MAVNSIPEFVVSVVQNSLRVTIPEGSALHWGLIFSCPSTPNMGLWPRQLLLPLAFGKPLKSTMLHMHLLQQKHNLECQVHVCSIVTNIQSVSEVPCRVAWVFPKSPLVQLLMNTLESAHSYCAIICSCLSQHQSSPAWDLPEQNNWPCDLHLSVPSKNWRSHICF